MKQIRVLIVDDHEVVRVGLQTVLRRFSGLSVVGETAFGEEGLRLSAELLPDVVLLDVRLPDIDGVEVCRVIRAKYPHVHVVMLTAFYDDEVLVSALLAGASGFVRKDVLCSELVEGIRTVAAGGSLLDDSVSERVLQRLRFASPTDVKGHQANLSGKERHILGLIAQGQTNKEIAHALSLSEKTVRNYVSSLLAKLKVNNRAEAAALAVRENLMV